MELKARSVFLIVLLSILLYVMFDLLCYYVSPEMSSLFKALASL